MTVQQAIARIAVCALTLSAIARPLFSEEKPMEPASEKTSVEFRQKFLGEFKHIILDTAAEDAMFLRICVEMSGAKRGVEVGTCRGFGAINMGIAFERTGGHLDTVDINPDMVAKARENLKTLGLEKTVTVIEGDALKVLPKLPNRYDFAFIDAVKSDYFQYLKDLEDKFEPCTVLSADNTIRYPGAMADFLDHLIKGPGYDAVNIRVSMKKNDGMILAYKIPAKGKTPSVAKHLDALDKMKKLGEPSTAIDPILLRIVAEASDAKRCLAVGSVDEDALLNLQIAMERTGGKLVNSNMTTKRDVKYDFLFLDGDKAEYLKQFKATESNLVPGAVILADATVRDAAEAKDLVDYLTKSPDYDVVTLHAEKKTGGVYRGMTLAYKIR